MSKIPALVFLCLFVVMTSDAQTPSQQLIYDHSPSKLGDREYFEDFKYWFYGNYGISPDVFTPKTLGLIFDDNIYTTLLKAVSDGTAYYANINERFGSLILSKKMFEDAIIDNQIKKGNATDTALLFRKEKLHFLDYSNVPLITQTTYPEIAAFELLAKSEYSNARYYLGSLRTKFYNQSNSYIEKEHELDNPMATYFIDRFYLHSHFQTQTILDIPLNLECNYLGDTFLKNYGDWETVGRVALSLNADYKKVGAVIVLAFPVKSRFPIKAKFNWDLDEKSLRKKADKEMDNPNDGSNGLYYYDLYLQNELHKFILDNYTNILLKENVAENYDELIRLLEWRIKADPTLGKIKNDLQPINAIQKLLADVYSSPTKINKDSDIAFALYKNSSLAGNGLACYRTANIYMQKNAADAKDSAIKFYRSGALYGNVDCALDLAGLLEASPKSNNKLEAGELYKRAFEADVLDLYSTNQGIIKIVDGIKRTNKKYLDQLIVYRASISKTDDIITEILKDHSKVKVLQITPDKYYADASVSYGKSLSLTYWLANFSKKNDLNTYCVGPVGADHSLYEVMGYTGIFYESPYPNQLATMQASRAADEEKFLFEDGSHMAAAYPKDLIKYSFKFEQEKTVPAFSTLVFVEGQAQPKIFDSQTDNKAIIDYINNVIKNN